MILDTLYPATFRGVEFLIFDGSTQGGRKNVTHEYPNSDQRYVEDLGKFRKIFTINGTITGTGIDYTFKRDALIQALEQPDRGLLSHPFYGVVNVTPKQYTVSESQQTLGRADFSMTFEESDEPIFPTISGAGIAQIASLANAVLQQSNQNIQDRYSAPISEPVNFADSQTQAREFIELLEDAATQVPPSTETFSTYFADLIEFRDDQVSIFSDSTQLGSQIQTQFTNLAFLADDPRDQLRILEPFFDFNSNPIFFIPSTPARIQRNENTETLRATILYNTLAVAYRTAITVEYETIEDLEQTRADLERRYNDIVSLEVNDDLRQQLEDLRTEARKFFEDLALNIARIEEVYTPAKAITVFAYQYYGDTDSDEDIIDLNNLENPAIVEGDVRILSR